MIYKVPLLPGQRGQLPTIRHTEEGLEILDANNEAASILTNALRAILGLHSPDDVLESYRRQSNCKTTERFKMNAQKVLVRLHQAKDAGTLERMNTTKFLPELQGNRKTMLAALHYVEAVGVLTKKPHWQIDMGLLKKTYDSLM